ncbi:LOG family protein [Streptomyces aculeolatus]
MDEMVNRAVTITGTRATRHRRHSDFAGLFGAYLAPFAADEASVFYLGGAKGIDTLALTWLAENTAVQLVVVVPGTLDQQPAEARSALDRHQARIAQIIELRAEALNTEAYHTRNRYMVDRSGMTIGFPHAGGAGSGTWQTLDYTAELGKPRLIVPV